jgi:hypothetical protein
MIDLTEQQESRKPEVTYVPEINETAFTKKDNSSEIVKELDLSRQNGVARLYFGDTRLNTEPPEESHNIFGTAWRALERGVVGAGAGYQKFWKMGQSEFYQLFSEIESKDQYVAQKALLNVKLRNKEITQEEYDAGMVEAGKQLKKAVEWDMQQKDLETQKLNKAFEKINLWNTRVSKNFARKEWEEKGLPGFVADIYESMPTTLASMSALLISKNPAVAVAFYGGTAGVQEVSDIASRELEAGASASDALGTGALTSVPVMALDFAGLKFINKLWQAPFNKYVTKSKFFNVIQDFVYKNRNSKNVWNALGTMARLGTASGAEELITETAQGAIENNLPRVVGYGPEFNGFFNEVMDWFYQGLVGAGSGFMLGGVGSGVSLHLTKKYLAERLSAPKDKGGYGLNKEAAERVSEELAPVLVSHAEEFSNQLKKEVGNMDISDTAAKQAAKALMDAFTPKDNSNLLKLIETSLDEQYPQGKGTANPIVANMLYIQAEQIAEAEGSSIEEAVSKQRIRIVNDPSSLDITDRFYNARNKKGEIVGAASKNITDNIIYLLNNATPDVLVHETTHLYLNVITAMLRSGKVNARFSAMIGNVLDYIGAPEGENYEFSEAQQEKLANTFQEIALGGEAPTAELAESFGQMSRMVASAYAGANKSKSLTPQAKKLFSDFFASRRAKTDIKVTMDDVARLKEGVNKILKGERIAVKDYKIIRDLLNFGFGYSPTFIGYSVEDFIKEHPEYNQQDNKGKLKMLADAGFEIASEQGLFSNADDAIKEIESKPEMVFLKSDTEAQERRVEIARYRDIEKVYREVFDNNRFLVQATAEAIKTLRKQGYVVTDKASMKQMSKDLTVLNAEVKKLGESLEKTKERTKKKVEQQKEKISQKVELDNARKTGKNIVNYVSKVIDIMADAGIDVETLESESFDIEQNLNKLSADEIYTRTNNLFKRVETFSNALLTEYYSSDAFIQQEGIEPPVVRQNELKVAIADTITSHIPTNNMPLDYRKLELDLAKMLRKYKVNEKYANLILNEMRKVNIFGGATLSDVIDNIVDKVNVEYHKQLAEKYDNRLSALKEKAKGKNLFATDNMAVSYISEKIKQMEEAAKNKKGQERRDAVDAVVDSMDFNRDIIGKDENGKDATLNPEQKAVANAFIAQKAAELKRDYSYPNQNLVDGYKTISMFSETSQKKVEQLLAEKQQKFNDAVQKAYLTVTNRKAMPKSLQLLDSGLFARLLGGLRSNLITVFGEDFANEYDTMVEYRKVGIRAREIKERVQRRMGEVLGDERLVQPYINRLELDKPYAKSTDPIGQLLKDYTRGQILDLYMIAQNEKGFRWVQRTFGKNAEAVISRINEGMSPLDKQYAKILMSELESIFPDLAKVYYEINGKPLGYQRYYWPLYTMQGSDGKTIRDDLSVFNASPIEKTNLTVTQERTGVSTDPEVDPTRVLRLDSPTEKFNRYINTVLKFQTVIPKLNTLSEVIFGQNPESEKLRKEISNKFGEGALKALRKDFQFNLGVLPYEEMSTMDKIMHEVFNNYVVAALARPLLIPKQAIGMLNYAENIPWLEFLPDLMEGLILHPIKTWKEMMSLKSVKNRFTGELPMALTQERSFSSTWLPSLLGIKGKAGGKITDILNKARTLSTYPTRLGDALAVVYGGYAFMKARERALMQNPEFQKLSKQEQQKVLENELIVQTEVSQQSGFGAAKGGLQRSEGGGSLETLGKRMLMVFSSTNVQFARKLREGIYEYRNGNITKSELGKRFLIYSLLNPLLYVSIGSLGTLKHMLQNLIQGDDDWKEELYLTMIRPILDNFFAMGGMAGEFPMAFADMVAEMAGQETYGPVDINMTPFFLKNISKKMGKKNKDVEDWLDMFLSAGQSVSPIPLDVSKTMLKSSVKALGGEDSAVNLLILLGFSERQAKRIVED